MTISNLNMIEAYLHCRICIQEGKKSHIACGWTVKGLQVWCEIHDVNIINIDFEDEKHPANTTASN